MNLCYYFVLFVIVSSLSLALAVSIFCMKLIIWLQSSTQKTIWHSIWMLGQSPCCTSKSHFNRLYESVLILSVNKQHELMSQTVIRTIHIYRKFYSIHSEWAWNQKTVVCGRSTLCVLNGYPWFHSPWSMVITIWFQFNGGQACVAKATLDV